MSYTYKKISELEPSTQMQHFYGKMIFHGIQGGRHVLLCKDETGSIYVWVKPKENQVLKFQHLQIIRFHRCLITTIHGSPQGTANIGKAGCHLVAWTKNGDPKSPVVISSKEWSRSNEDRERIKTLSEMDQNAKSKSVDELASELIDVRETQRAKVIVSNWLRKARIEDLEKRKLATRELYAQRPGSLVTSNGAFPVDPSFFENHEIELIQFIRRCDDCFEEVQNVRYLREPKPGRCPSCRKFIKTIEMAIRVLIDVDGYNLTFTIPIELIKKQENASEISNYAPEFSNDEIPPELEKFCRKVQRALWTTTITEVHGRIMGRSEVQKFLEIFVFDAKILGVNQ